MTMIIFGYIAAIAAVSLFLVNREQRRENLEMRYELTQAERRVLFAEREAGALAARHALAGRLCEMPYRMDLHAAYARIEILERANEQLTAQCDRIREVLPPAPLPAHARFEALRIRHPALPAPFLQLPPEGPE